MPALLDLLQQTQAVAAVAALARLLRAVVVTPAMHKVHHSRLRLETGSNYSSLFSWWDRLFRSFRLRDRPEEIDFGLDGFDEEAYQSVGGMLRTPFDRLAKSRGA